MHTINSKSGKTIAIRPPQEGDVHIMLDYINAIGKEDIYVNVNPSDLYTLEVEQNYLDKVLLRIEKRLEVMFLAFYQDKLIGSVGVNRKEKRSKHIGLFGITLAEDFRSDGIGMKLSEYTLEKAKELLRVNLIILSVYKPNHPAINLYKKLGFQQYGLLPNGLSYKDGYLDEILMYKNL